MILQLSALNFLSKKNNILYCREILLLVNLCVALGNAYITPLPALLDDFHSPSSSEPTPAPPQATPAPKKGGKGDAQAAVVSVAPPGSSIGVKPDDNKAALDVSCLIIKRSIAIFYYILNKRYANMQLIKQMKKLLNLYWLRFEIVKRSYSYGLLLSSYFNNQLKRLSL